MSVDVQRTQEVHAADPWRIDWFDSELHAASVALRHLFGDQAPAVVTDIMDAMAGESVLGQPESREELRMSMQQGRPELDRPTVRVTVGVLNRLSDALGGEAAKIQHVKNGVVALLAHVALGYSASEADASLADQRLQGRLWQRGSAYAAAALEIAHRNSSHFMAFAREHGVPVVQDTGAMLVPQGAAVRRADTAAGLLYVYDHAMQVSAQTATEGQHDQDDSSHGTNVEGLSMSSSQKEILIADNDRLQRLIRQMRWINGARVPTMLPLSEVRHNGDTIARVVDLSVLNSGISALRDIFTNSPDGLAALEDLIATGVYRLVEGGGLQKLPGSNPTLLYHWQTHHGGRASRAYFAPSIQTPEGIVVVPLVGVCYKNKQHELLSRLLQRRIVSGSLDGRRCGGR